MTEHISAPKDLDKPIRQRYRAVFDSNKGSGWPKGHIQVFKDDEVVYEYDRNYSFLYTFEPFRQWNGTEWRNYALISPRYSTYQVLDLQTYEVIAERPYPQRNWYKSDTYDEYQNLRKNRPELFAENGVYAGKGPEDKISGEGFCPAEFYVPDFASWDSDGDGGRAEDEHMDADYFEKYQDEILTGQLGFVSGCIWGDDSSWKVRAIDLSRISEGIITEDERFGYIALPPQLKLHQAVSWYWQSAHRVKIAVDLCFDTRDGKLGYWHKDELPEFKEKK